MEKGSLETGTGERDKQETFYPLLLSIAPSKAVLFAFSREARLFRNLPKKNVVSNSGVESNSGAELKAPPSCHAKRTRKQVTPSGWENRRTRAPALLDARANGVWNTGASVRVSRAQTLPGV